MTAVFPAVESDPVALAALTSAVSTLNAAMALRQLAATAATDVELADVESDLDAAVAGVQAELDALELTSATDAEVASAVAAVNAVLAAHAANTANPHAVTKAQVGLGAVDNTADSAKPVSSLQQTALDLKAPLASPALTGTPTVPTQTVGNSSTRVASTAYVQGEVTLDRTRLSTVESSRDLNIRDVVGLDAGGTTDMASLINTASLAAKAVAVAGGYPYVTLGGFGRGVYRIDTSLLIRDRVKFNLDDARIIAGADFTTQNGIFRAQEVLNAAVAQGTGITTSGSFVITAVSQPSLWTVEDRITGTGIPADTKIVAVDVANARLVLDAAASASATVTLTKAATFYGNYRNAGLIGGELDPNGKVVNATVRALWTENFTIEGTRILHNRAASDPDWAWQVGGRNMLAKWPEVMGGANLFEDGFHFMHGQNLRLIAPYIESGDDAIALGGEIADSSLAASPDPVRDVTITNANVRSLRAFGLKIYATAGATGRDWEVTDVSVDGLVGKTGILRNGGIWIEDYNSGLPGGVQQIKRIKIKGVNLDIGSKSHDDFQGRGFHCASASDVTVDGTIRLTEGAVAPSGMDLAVVNNSEDMDIRLKCPALGQRAGLWAVNSSRVTLHDCLLRVTPATTSAPVRLRSCPEFKLINNDIHGLNVGQSAVQVTEGFALTTIQARGNTLRRGTNPTNAGYMFNATHDMLVKVIAGGNDIAGLNRMFFDEAELRQVPFFRVEGNAGQCDLRMTDLAPWVPVAHMKQQFSAAAMTTTILQESGAGIPSGTAGGLGVFKFDPADYGVNGLSTFHGVTGNLIRMRIVVEVITNGTAPTSTFAASLYPVTVPAAGGAAAVPVTLGTIVSGSTATSAAPAAEAAAEVVAEFNAPTTAGLFAIGLVISGANMVANSSAVVRARLQARAL